jgi:hypothetical protein
MQFVSLCPLAFVARVQCKTSAFRHEPCLTLKIICFGKHFSSHLQNEYVGHFLEALLGQAAGSERNTMDLIHRAGQQAAIQVAIFPCGH